MPKRRHRSAPAKSHRIPCEDEPEWVTGDRQLATPPLQANTGQQICSEDDPEQQKGSTDITLPESTTLLPPQPDDTTKPPVDDGSMETSSTSPAAELNNMKHTMATSKLDDCLMNEDATEQSHDTTSNTSDTTCDLNGVALCKSGENFSCYSNSGSTGNDTTTKLVDTASCKPNDTKLNSSTMKPNDDTSSKPEDGSTRTPDSNAASIVPTRQSTRTRSSSYGSPNVITRQTRRMSSGKHSGRKPTVEEESDRIQTPADVAPVDKEAEELSQRTSPRKSKRTPNVKESCVGSPAETTVSCKAKKGRAITRSRKRKNMEPERDVKAKAMANVAESTAATTTQKKSPTIDAATSPFVKTVPARGRKRSTAPKPKRTRNARGKGKRKGKKRGPLPSFDDEDDNEMEQLGNTGGVDESAVTRHLNFELETNHQSSMQDHLNEPDSMDEEDLGASYNDNADETLGTSYDDMDLDSNQSSDDDLPDVLSQESKKILEGDMIWAKMRNYPYWPAVVKKLYKNKGKATVLFAGELNKSTQKGKGVPLRVLKPYLCPEKDNLIDAGLKHPKVQKGEFQEAIDKAEDYITKRGLGKTKGLSFFTTEDYSLCDENLPMSDTPLSITCSPSMMAGLPLDKDTATTSPLTPPCDFPYSNGMDSPTWKTGLSPNENLPDHSIDGDSEVDEELLEKKNCLIKLQDRLMRYILKRPSVKEHLLKIYHGDVKSKRHKLYFTPGPEAKYTLEQLRGFGPVTDDEQQDELMKFLRNLYTDKCIKDKNEDVVFTSTTTTYLTDVWFPESIIFALQKTQRIGLKKAEQMFVSEEKKAMELTGDLDDISMMKHLTKEEKEELMQKSVRRAARHLGLSPRELGLS